MIQDERETLLQKLAETNAKLHAIELQLDAANKKLNEYEEKAKNAEQASRMKSLFLANMSHEIRTPLNAIEGFSRVMAETDSPEERMKYMEIIESNNGRLLALIDDILDLSRVEAGEISIKKGMTDLNDLCHSLQNIFKFRCPDSLQLVWNKPNMKVTLNTDANRVTQVMSNLIGNANLAGYRVGEMKAKKEEYAINDISVSAVLTDADAYSGYVGFTFGLTDRN